MAQSMALLPHAINVVISSMPLYDQSAHLDPSSSQRGIGVFSTQFPSTRYFKL
jgi:hypothetical protein